MKTCTKCGRTFPATTEFFHRSKSYNDGFKYTCKTCRREYEHQRIVNLGGKEWSVVEDLPGEKWRGVVGHEDLYSVSSLGRVKRTGAGPGTFSGRLISPCKDHRGYLRLNMGNGDGTRKSCPCHKLVAEAFICPRPNGLQVNHIDGDKENNMVDNLEYVTPSENVVHSYRIGLASNKGERHPRSTITDNCARKIIEMVDSGDYTAKEIASLNETTLSVVSHIKYGQSWGWLK